MKNTIITANLKELTLSSKFVEFKAPSGVVILDIAKLMLSSGADAYFNATDIARMFTGTARQATVKLNKYFTSDRTKAYLKVVENQLLNNVTHMGDITNPLKAKGFKRPLKVKIVRRGYTKDNAFKNGTWLHNDMALDFMRYLDAEFAYACDQFLKQVISQAHVLHIERKETITRFHPLTDAIKDIYIPAQETENAKQWAYQSLLNLANVWAIGMTSSEYKIKHGIVLEKNKGIRDYMSECELEQVTEAEKHIHAFLYYMRVASYKGIKELLNKQQRVAL